MSAPINDGGPAFACDVYEPRSEGIPAGIIHCRGMSLRDYFAARALQGILAHQTVNLITDDGITPAECYQWADAMIAEREKNR